MDLTTHDRLARLKALRLAPASALVRPSVADRRSILDQSPEDMSAQWPAEIEGAEVKRNHYGEYVAVSRWFPKPVSSDPDALALRLLSPGAPQAVADPAQWLFLDIETTGLAGGTGTYAFLVGIAWWDAGGIQVEQLFMRDLNEEWPLLATLAERLQQRPVLVTFNGKSFDWPLLETRYRMTRTLTPPEPLAHLDFLHPARSLWRLKLGSVRLAELEREVLGWDRGPDLLSDLIPRLYLDFLRGGSWEQLLPIFRHNQQDLRGLAALSGRVLSLLSDPEACGRDPLELYGVSRICERRGELQRARRLYEHSLASTLPLETARAAQTSLARLAKREGDFTMACELWAETLGASRQGFEAYEQLAIYHEHHAREPQQAAEITRQALAELHRALRLGAIALPAYQRARRRFEHRLARLERRQMRALNLSFGASGS